MREYRPFSQERLATQIEKLNQGKLSTLDVQIGGHCNARCEKCDTPNYYARNNLDLDALETHVDSGNVDSLVICGKGEPTSSRNIESTSRIIQMGQRNGADTHAFINGLEIDNTIWNVIESGDFNVLVQFNSFDVDNVITQMSLDKLYGGDAEQKARQHIANLYRLAEIAKSKSGNDTNIGVSIVPNTRNEHELESMLDFAMNNNMAVLCGELEQAGASTGETYNRLAIPKKRLLRVQDMLREREIPTQTPVCPYIFSSVHVNNNNRVSVDKMTGLSCTWFNLQDNNMAKKQYFGKIGDKTFEQFSDEIIAHRISVYQHLKKIVDSQEMPLIGGCGGNPKEVMRILKETTENVARHKGVNLDLQGKT